MVHKEFYFLRHGQTEYNAKDIQADHPAFLPLNDTGRSQALEVEPVIASLPIKKICCSPMNRAIETKQIVTSRLTLESIEIPHLGECTYLEWYGMMTLGNSHHSVAVDPVRSFFDRVRKGLEEALKHEGPVLIVSHAGVHWAVCSLLEIEEHNWLTDNCVPIHFFADESGRWKAKKLIHHR